MYQYHGTWASEEFIASLLIKWWTWLFWIKILLPWVKTKAHLTSIIQPHILRLSIIFTGESQTDKLSCVRKLFHVLAGKNNFRNLSYLWWNRKCWYLSWKKLFRVKNVFVKYTVESSWISFDTPNWPPIYILMILVCISIHVYMEAIFLPGVPPPLQKLVNFSLKNYNN